MDGPRNLRMTRPPRWAWLVLGALSAAFLASPCFAYAPPTPLSGSAPAKGLPDTTPTDTYRISALSEHPELTPEEVGRRMLRLLDGLGSMDELTTEQVVLRMGLPLKYAPKGKVYAFTIQMPDSPWYYGVTYRDDHETKMVELEYSYFGDSMPEGSPLCPMSVDETVRRFKKDGYSLWIDVDELGQALAYYFERPALKVRVVPGTSVNNKETGAYHLCVSQLMITSVD